MDFARARMEGHQTTQNDASSLPIETDGLSLKGQLILLGVSVISAGLMGVGVVTIAQYVLRYLAD